MRMHLEIVAAKHTLIKIVIAINLIVFLVYLIMINTVTKLDPNSPWAVFLPPRWYPGVNDVPADQFNQWGGMLFVAAVTGIFILSYKNFTLKISYLKFLLFAYSFTYLTTFSFVLMSSNSLNQYILQARSVNNGIVYSIGHLLGLEDFANLDWFGRVQYIFQILSSNYADYTIPGTTHPPGFFLIFFAIAGIVKLLSYNDSINVLMVYWTLIVTAINCLLVPLVLLIVRKIFGNEYSRGALSFVVTIPSIAFHICAMGEIIGSVLLLFGVYIILHLNTKVQTGYISSSNVFFASFFAGCAFITAAQISYSQIVPVLSISIAALIAFYKSLKSVLLLVVSGYLLPVFTYFIFEFLISNGESFYPIRALYVSNIVDTVLLNPIRPYPTSQIANWIIMSVYGGILFIPTLLIILLGRKKYYLLIGFSKSNTNLNFIFCATYLMGIGLILSRTAHLEVERVWHWYLPFVWILSVPILFNKLLPEFKFKGRIVVASRMIPFLQLMMTIFLATYLIDYY